MNLDLVLCNNLVDLRKSKDRHFLDHELFEFLRMNGVKTLQEKMKMKKYNKILIRKYKIIFKNFVRIDKETQRILRNNDDRNLKRLKIILLNTYWRYCYAQDFAEL